MPHQVGNNQNQTAINHALLISLGANQKIRPTIIMGVSAIIDAIVSCYVYSYNMSGTLSFRLVVAIFSITILPDESSIQNLTDIASIITDLPIYFSPSII